MTPERLVLGALTLRTRCLDDLLRGHQITLFEE
jgi:hypothetical protein